TDYSRTDLREHAPGVEARCHLRRICGGAGTSAARTRATSGRRAVTQSRSAQIRLANHASQSTVTTLNGAEHRDECVHPPLADLLSGVLHRQRGAAGVARTRACAGFGSRVLHAITRMEALRLAG